MDLVDTLESCSQNECGSIPHVSKRFAAGVWDGAGLRCELLFPAFDYAQITAAGISALGTMLLLT